MEPRHLLALDCLSREQSASDADDGYYGAALICDACSLTVEQSGLSALSTSAINSSSISTTINRPGDPQIDSLIGGYKWDGNSLTRITFSFYSGGRYSGPEQNPGPLSAAAKENVRQILYNLIQPVINISFSEVPDSESSYGMIRYATAAIDGYAYAFMPDARDGGRMGNVVLSAANDQPWGYGSFQRGAGSWGFLTLIHETLHALGLKHPGNYNGSAPGTPPFMSYDLENFDNTLMTYNNVSGVYPAMPMAFDIKALQYLYGKKTRTGNDTYRLSGDYFGVKRTIWDGGGTDTIDCTELPVLAATDSYRIDIRSNGWIAASSAFNGAAYDVIPGPPTRFVSGATYKAMREGTRIAADTLIEYVNVSQASDKVYLNDAANRVGGYSAGVSSGSDEIYLSDASDVLDLRSFREANVSRTQVGNDLVLGLGMGSSVTIKNYFGVPSTARMSIAFGDPAVVTISADTAVVVEGALYPSNWPSFTLTRSGSTLEALDVNIVYGGTAVVGKDYIKSWYDTQASFSKGESTCRVGLRIVDDWEAEENETITLRIGTGSGYAAGPASMATISIVDNDSDDDDLPNVISGDAVEYGIVQSDGSGDNGEFWAGGWFDVERRNWVGFNLPTVSRPVVGARLNVWVYFSNSDETYELHEVTASLDSLLSVGGGQAKFVDLADGPVYGSRNILKAETLTNLFIDLNSNALTAVNSRLGNSFVMGGIVTTLDADKTNNETIFQWTLGQPPSLELTLAATPVVTVSATDTDAAEGSPTNFGLFTLRRTGSTASSLSVNVSLSGTATNGVDYLTIPSTVTFAAGSSTAVVNVSVLNDALAEQSEAVVLAVTAGTGYVVGNLSSATVVIQDSDAAAPIVTVSATDSDAAEGSPTNPGLFTLTRTGSTASSLSVNVSVSGAATNGVDYTTIPSAVTFAAGSSTAVVNVSVLNDDLAEQSETVVLAVTAGTGYVVGNSSSATVVIQEKEDDRPVISLVASDASAGEGSPSNSGLFTLTRTGWTSKSLSVTVSVSGTATNGVDYTTIPSTVTFAAGSSTAVVTVSVLNDDLVEPSETVVLTVTAATGYVVGNSSSATVVIQASLSAPTLIAPSGIITSTTPMYSWNAVTGADHYALVVYDNNTSQYVVSTSVYGTRWWSSDNSLVAGHSYSWQVTALDSAGHYGLSSNSSSFTITQSLSAPTLIAPLGNITGTIPTFSWSAVAGDAHYRLAVFDNTVLPYGQWVVQKDYIYDTSWTSSVPLAVGHRYTWKVIALGPNESPASPWSQGDFFIVPPGITSTGSLGALSTTYGTASNTTTVIVAGSNLADDIVATVPNGFEVSSDGVNYSASTTFRAMAGTVSGTAYVRLSARAAAGSYSGVLRLTSAGATSVTTPIPNSTVAPKTLTVTGIAIANKTYDGTTFATVSGTATYSGLVAGEAFAVLGRPTAAFADKNAGSGKAVSVTGYQSPSSNYTIAEPVRLKANIALRALTVSGATAVNKVYDGATTVSISGGQLVGVLANEKVVLGGSPIGFVPTKDVGNGKAVTVSGYSIGGISAGNYLLVQPTGLTANIAPKALTVTGLTAASKVYDGTNAAALTGTAALFGRVGNDDVAISGTASGIFATKNAGANQTVKVGGMVLAGGTASNYTLAPLALSGTIFARTLVVHADNKTRQVNSANPPLTATITGFANGESAATALTGKLQISTAARWGSRAGSYAIQVGKGTLRATNGNYVFSFIDGTITVTAPVATRIAR